MAGPPPSGPGDGAATRLWPAALDAFEATLDGYVDLAMAAHDPGSELPPVPSFTPPAGLGPLPAGLRLRAGELAARAALIETELIRVRDQAVGELAALSRPRAVYHAEQVSRFDHFG